MPTARQPNRLRAILITTLILVVIASGVSIALAINQPSSKTPVHEAISTTYFQAGAPAGEFDQGISNKSSAWYTNWAEQMCGIDYDGTRTLTATGCDNLFYAALPCADFDVEGPLADHIAQSPWPSATPNSTFKNKWIEVTYGDAVVYVQWEDVGPLYVDDCAYVFEGKRPRSERSGAVGSALDLSPLAFKTLTGGDLTQGIIMTSWRFVNETDVPNGPWKLNPTTAGPSW